MNTRERLLYIMDRISKEYCSSEQLTFEIFETKNTNKKRLIQKDLEILREHFKEKIIKTNKKYKFLKVPYFMQNIATTDGIKMKELIEFLMVFDNKMLSLFEKEEPFLIQNLKKEIRSIYLIFEPPLEIINPTFSDEIKRAIINTQYMTITYKGNHHIETYIDIKPYRIIYGEGNWYLAIYDANWDKKYNLLRINFIQSVKLHSKTFHKDIEIERAIESFQSLLAKPDKKSFEVIIEVDGVGIKHFKKKKYLKSQKIIKEDRKKLTISFQITDALEITPLIIKKWMPYVVVVSPKSIQETLCRDAEKFLEKQRRLMDDKKDI